MGALPNRWMRGQGPIVEQPMPRSIGSIGSAKRLIRQSGV